MKIDREAMQWLWLAGVCGRGKSEAVAAWALCSTRFGKGWVALMLTEAQAVHQISFVRSL